MGLWSVVLWVDVRVVTLGWWHLSDDWSVASMGDTTAAKTDASMAECWAGRKAASRAASTDVTMALTMDACWAGRKAALRAMMWVGQTESLTAAHSAAR